MDKKKLLEYYVPKSFIKKELMYKFNMGLLIGIAIGVALASIIYFIFSGPYT